jgi:hypothetical protein
VNCTRFYTDDKGETHLEDISVDLAEVDFAPPAAPLLMSRPIATQNLLFCEVPDNWDGSWHPSPARQYFVSMSGTLEIEVSDGAVRQFHPGDLALVEDTSGKGHATRTVGEARASVLFIQLPD